MTPKRSAAEIYRARMLRHAYRAGRAVCPVCGPGARCRCTVEEVAEFNARQATLPGVDLAPSPAPVPEDGPGSQRKVF